ncbi:MAG: Ppx/GppA family phosphatase [Bryobacteraceae bacterium]|nr:Ppx/GppA family phosphatase [Bryobacteraceae bacterium]
MPRYAAVDIGSNSVRLLVAEVTPGLPPKELASAREVTRLGESVFRTGTVSPEAAALVTGVLAKMAQAYRPFGVAGIRAVATAAVRDASNQQQFLRDAAEAIGAPVEVISGQEEARLIHLGVQSTWPHPAHRVLIVDVGGGSAEIVRSEAGKMTAAYSKPVGAVRLTEVFLKTDPPEARDLHRLEEYIEEKIAGAVERMGKGRWDRAIGTSATAAAIVSAVNRVPRSRRESVDRLRATSPQIRRFYQQVGAKSLAERRKITGVGPRRAEIIVAGAAVFHRIAQDFRIPSLYYSSAGVRNGIIADLAERGVGRELSRLKREQRQSVELLAKHYGVSVKHVRKVADLAHTLFESLQPIHKLAPSYGVLLDAAAYLHDIGHYVSDTAHHKHSAYLAANSDMPGFTSEERRLISLLCRYHRKSMPTERHPEFEALSETDKRVVLLLTPLLRLADSLDRSHAQRVEAMECQMRNGNVAVYIQSAADTDLEQWAGERAGEIFRQVYGVPLALVKVKG